MLYEKKGMLVLYPDPPSTLQEGLGSRLGGGLGDVKDV